jgi:hypothetical protein
MDKTKLNGVVGWVRVDGVGDSRIGWNPRTYVRRNSIIYARKNLITWRQEISENLTSSSLVVNLFTRALGHPFIGRHRDFYIPRLPSNLENIPSVNMYINDFYILWFAELILYIYSLATSSHFKPGLLRWCFWLGSPWLPKLYSWKTPLIGVPELRLLQTPKFRRFQVSWTSPISRLPNFAGSRSLELHQFQTPELRRFHVSWTSPVSNHPETDNRFANWSHFSYYFRISLEGQRNVWNSSGSLHECFLFHERELSIPMLIHEYTYEFGNSDVSRVKGFFPIPQHMGSVKCGV